MLYIVTRKSDGAEVFRYNAEAAVEWTGYEFDNHLHVAAEAPAVVEVNPADWYINVGPFFDRFGTYKLPILASSDLLVQAIIRDASVRQYIDLRGRRAELLQAIGLLKAKGFAVSESAILDVQPNEAEVHRA